MRAPFRGLTVVALIAAVAVAGSVTPAGSQAKPAAKKLDLAYLLSPPESGAVGLKFLAEEVTKRSNGSINMVFHGGSLLNKELEAKGMKVNQADVQSFRKLAEEKIWPQYKQQYAK